MKTENQKYVRPEIEIIVLDNEISLALESNPPFGPDEEYVMNDHLVNKTEFIS